MREVRKEILLFQAVFSKAGLDESNEKEEKTLIDTDIEYIRKDAALACFHDWIDRYGHEHTADEIAEYQRIDDLPCEDVVTVHKGKWIAHQEGRWIYAKCSECGTVHDGRSDYCPSCGAIMKEASDD